MHKTHCYRNHIICPRCEVDCNHAQNAFLRWSIDLRDADDTMAEYSHGYATLADCRRAIDEIEDRD